jgi:hypothetical protein
MGLVSNNLEEYKETIGESFVEKWYDTFQRFATRLPRIRVDVDVGAL